MNHGPKFSRRLALALPALATFSNRDVWAAEDIFLLVNARNPTASLTRGTTKNLFLGKTVFWHGVVPVKLFVRPGTGAPGKAFYDPIVGMSAQSFAQHWSKLQLAGKGVTPPKIADVTELAERVAKVPGGLGFVLGAEAWDAKGVKVIPIK